MAEINLAQILRGTANEFLSQIRQCQGRAVLQFILGPSGNIGELVMVFGENRTFLTIWI